MSEHWSLSWCKACQRRANAGEPSASAALNRAEAKSTAAPSDAQLKADRRAASLIATTAANTPEAKADRRAASLAASLQKDANVVQAAKATTSPAVASSSSASAKKVGKPDSTTAKAPPLANTPAVKSSASGSGSQAKPCVDYSKWSQFKDSDDEDEDVKAPVQQGNDTADHLDVKWEGRHYTQVERLSIVDAVMDTCRDTHTDAKNSFGQKSNTPAPQKVKLPADHKKAMNQMSVAQLAKYKCSNDRMLVSLYGDIFDVSSRPDMFGYGKFSTQAGKDITWAVITGEENEKNFNRFYDIFKLDEEHLGRYLQILCQRLVAFEEEFGEPVGRLDKFTKEWELPPAPKDEIEECKQQ